MILVTGGAGFIGAHFVIDWLQLGLGPVLNVDKLSYAGNLHNLDCVQDHQAHHFVQADIGDRALMAELLAQYRPRAVVHLAAHSHVDRSIAAADDFVHTNMVGSFELLEAVRAYWQSMAHSERAAFRFLHVSTDEVYGSLEPGAPAFTEEHAYAPNSPYSASKAAADHLVRAWHHTYGLPVLTTHCSNNYGPMQFPEKLLPHMLVQALAGEALPLYGDGLQVRDWLYVGDHCQALRQVLDHGEPGQTYNIGANCERSNLALVQALCQLLDQLHPRADARSYAQQITHVSDRPGHDRRYAINAGKLRQTLGWQAQHSLDSGLRSTVQWYLDHPQWLQQVLSGAYRQHLPVVRSGQGVA